jgi:hypothetical protein
LNRASGSYATVEARILARVYLNIPPPSRPGQFLGLVAWNSLGGVNEASKPSRNMNSNDDSLLGAPVIAQEMVS